MTDLVRVKKIYKLNNGSSSAKTSGNDTPMSNGTAREQEEKKEMEIVILGSMATRGFTN
jgi:EKC/KEOPS complex subunit CGI121/TPRKB